MSMSMPHTVVDACVSFLGQIMRLAVARRWLGVRAAAHRWAA